MQKQKGDDLTVQDIRIYIINRYGMGAVMHGIYGICKKKTYMNIDKMTMVSRFTESEAQAFFTDSRVRHSQRRMKELKKWLQTHDTAQSKDKRTESEEEKKKEEAKVREVTGYMQDMHVNVEPRLDGDDAEAEAVANDDEFEDEFVQGVLESLGMVHYVVAFRNYGITTDALSNLSEHVVAMIVTEEKLQRKFLKWLRDYQQSCREYEQSLFGGSK